MSLDKNLRYGRYWYRIRSTVFYERKRWKTIVWCKNWSTKKRVYLFFWVPIWKETSVRDLLRILLRSLISYEGPSINYAKKKNGFVTATKLGTTNNFLLLLQPKILPQQPNGLLIEPNILVLTKYFCYPYFNKWFCWYNKTFFSVAVCKMGHYRITFRIAQILPLNKMCGYVNACVDCPPPPALEGDLRRPALMKVCVHFLRNLPCNQQKSLRIFLYFTRILCKKSCRSVLINRVCW